MNIDVLLTEEEFTKAYESVTNRIQGISTRMQAGREAQNKAQCLKLLDVLKKPCKHTLYAGPGRTIRRVFRLIDCPPCMAEIEKLLKEQVDGKKL